MKNNILILFLLTGVLSFTSCEKFLDPAPISQIGSSGFYKNADEINAGVVAIYDGLQEVPNIEYAVTEMRSDNSKTRTSEGEWAEFEFMNINTSNAGVSTYWSALYNVIFRANVVLPHLDVVENTTERDQYEGEIRFLRAMMYFDLVRAFGDVPLVDKVIGPEEEEYFGRKPASTVYDFIVSDLTAAISKLPLQSDIAVGRATKGAAQTLLAKVYLTLGKYTEAKDLLTAVIGSGEYTWEANYHDIFFTQNSPAIIFGLQFVAGDANNGQEFSYAFSPKGRAGGLNWPSASLHAAIDTTVDLRTSTLFAWNIDAGSSGDWQCGKYANPDNLEYAGNPWVFLRLADAYLMYAEATLGGAASTTDATALGYVNMIRTRAGLTDLTEITADNLLKERRVELAFENHRLFDMIRFGKADAIMSAYSTTAEAGFVFTSSDLLLPIPQREIDIYDIPQNPGY